MARIGWKHCHELLKRLDRLAGICELNVDVPYATKRHQHATTSTSWHETLQLTNAAEVRGEGGVVVAEVEVPIGTALEVVAHYPS